MVLISPAYEGNIMTEQRPRSMLIWMLFILIQTLVPAITGTTWAQPADAWLREFSAQWDDAAWTSGKTAGASPSGRRMPYMRPLDDQGWQVRMKALQGLVAGGENSISPLLNALENGDIPARQLAAQTLG